MISKIDVIFDLLFIRGFLELRNVWYVGIRYSNGIIFWYWLWLIGLNLWYWNLLFVFKVILFLDMLGKYYL